MSRLLFETQIKENYNYIDNLINNIIKPKKFLIITKSYKKEQKISIFI